MALLERETELEILAGAIGAAADGDGSCVVVQGPAGIGKTRLVAAAREQAARSGVRALAARGGELERDFAFGVVRRLFEPVVREGRDATFDGAASLAAPVLGTGKAGPLDADPSAALLHGLYWALANAAAEEPLLVAVDDAHWADPASLRWLAYVMNRLEELPVAVLVAARTDEPEAAPAPLAMLSSGSGTRLVSPAPLTAGAVASIVRARVEKQADDEFCEACHTATAGNPFMLGALLDAVESDQVATDASGAARVEALGPESIARAILPRLARLSEEAGALAEAVAVLGVAAPLRHAAAVAGVELDAAGDAADALADAGVLTPGRPLDFVHPVVRASIHAELRPAQRTRGHRAAAELLAAEGEDEDRIAAHLLHTEAGSDPWVVEMLRSAAGGALASGAADAAVAHLRRALAEPPPAELRGALLAELGSAEARVPDPAAEKHLRQAVELLEEPLPRAAAEHELGRALMLGGRLPDAVEVLDRAIEKLGDPDAELSMTLEAELLNAARLDLSTRPLAARRVAATVTRAERGGSPGERLLLANLAYETALTGHSAERAARLAERALGNGALLEEAGPGGAPFIGAANALALCERLDLARQAFDDALDAARARGSALGHSIASCFRSQVAYRLGDLREAEADARGSLEVAGLHGWALGLPASLAFLIDVLIERGELEQAAAALERSGLGEEIPDSVMFTPLVDSRGRLRIAQSRLEEGIEDLLLCGRRQEEWGSPNPSVIPWRSHAAVACVRLGRSEDATRLAREEVELARAFGAPRALGMALRAAGIAEGGDTGLALLRETVETLAGSMGRLEHARALVALGSALRRAGERAAARDPLRQGLDLARRCGAGALAEEAREELAATGARLRREALSGVDSLTPSERRVATMAAQSMSNREIAQALFVTIKTVEVHLGHTYGKLEISSRGELPEALRGG
ncbi:MAG: AAA family ATPase [Thermoleophilaceae bacterium]